MGFFQRRKELALWQDQLEKYLIYYENEMYYAAYDILKSETDAEQAMFLAYKHVIRHPEYIKKESPEAIKNVLILCARQRAINLYNKRKKHPVVSVEENDHLLGKTEDLDQKVELANALSMLSEEDRQVLLLRFSHGYEYHEIAKLLQVKEMTVRKRVSRAKLRFERICIAKGLIDSKGGNPDE